MCNGTSVTDSDVVILGSLRGGAAFLCALVNGVLLTAILFHSDKTSPLHRLLIYISFSSFLVLVANTLQVESVGCSAHWHALVCESVGFLNQFTACVMLMVALWLIALLALQYWCPNNRVILTPKLDVLMWGALITLSMVSAIIPLGTDGYGIDWAWCWIKASRQVEQLALWYGWVLVSMAFALVFLASALCYSERRMATYYESSRGINSCKQQMNRETARRTKSLICWMGLYTIIVSVVIVLKQIPQIEKERTFLVIMGVLEPLSVVTVPAVFITHLYESRQCLKATERPRGLPPPPFSSHSQPDGGAPARGKQGDRGTPTRGVGWMQGSEDTGEEVTASLLLTQTLRSDYSESI